MFKTIFFYEIKYALRQPAFYVYAFVLAALGFITMAGTAGFFDPAAATDQGVQNLVNTPLAIYGIFFMANKLFLFLLPLFIGQGLYKDYQSRMYLILYSFPLRKNAYLIGKFIACFLLVIGMVLITMLGVWVAEHLPGLDPQKMAPAQPLAYVHVFLWFLLPNLLLHGILVFGAVLCSRNILAGFGVVIGLIVLQSIVENTLSAHPEWLAIADPFGENTVRYITQYWTAEERQWRPIPGNALIFWNRLFWSVLTLFMAVPVIAGFRFVQFNKTIWRSKSKPRSFSEPRHPINLADIQYRFGIKEQLKIGIILTFRAFLYTISQPLFLSISGLGLLSMIFLLNRVTQQEDATYLPVTQLIMGAPMLIYSNIILLLTFLYAGILLFRERNAGIHPLTDLLPVKNHVFLLSMATAILLVQGLLLAFGMATGILFQMSQGFYELEIATYSQYVLFQYLPGLAIWGFASLFVYTLVPRFYPSLFILLLGWLGFGVVAGMNIVPTFLLFNQQEPLSYSGFYGFGAALKPFLYIKLFWFVFSIFLLFITHLLWVRGTSQSALERGRLLKKRTRITDLIAPILLSLIFVGAGMDLYKKHTANAALTPNALTKTNARFQHKFSRYKDRKQPAILSLKVALDFFPEEQKFSAEGRYILQNQTQQPIDTLLIKMGFDETSTFTLSDAYKLLQADEKAQFYMIKLSNPLAPGEQLKMDFTICNKPNTFFENYPGVVSNGSFLKQDIFPRFGYPNEMLTDTSLAKQVNYQAMDAHLVDFEATLSTVPDQIALAPGTLQKKWIEKGRVYFHYKTEAPVKFAFSFHSGAYTHYKTQWQHTHIHIYSLPQHGFNLPQMSEGLKAALAFNTKYFGPFLHKEISIVEFPSAQGSYATLFGNLMPISETRFLANTRDTLKINLPFYVAAHELTHHWWGNQLMPANTAGATMLTESITEYISFKIYARQFGHKKAALFLQKQHQRYFGGILASQKAESPLSEVLPEESDIAYGKGAIAFYALFHYTKPDSGEIWLNDFLQEHRKKAPPYPTPSAFLGYLKNKIPIHLQPFLEDYFHKTIVWNIKIDSAYLEKKTDLKDQLQGKITLTKTNRNHKDSSKPAIADWVEIAGYNKQDSLVFTKKIWLQKEHTAFQMELPVGVKKIVIDPNLLLLEINRKDNNYYF